MKKIEGLQDLRGIAILMVVLFHVGNVSLEKNYFVHGGNGVYLFFIISGFIISSIHSRDKGFYKLRRFMEKRAVRVYLPYLPLFMLFVLLFMITGKGDEYHHDVFNIARNFFLVQNPARSIHPYSWSLVYEMFYYVTFGLVSILFGWPLYMYALLLLVPVLIGKLVPGSADSLMMLASHYNLYFLSGVLIAYWKDGFRYRVSSLFLFFLFIVFFFAPYYIHNEWLLLFISTVFFVAYLSWGRSLAALNVLGNASYSVYLFHALVVAVGKYAVPDIYLVKFAVLLLASIVLGYLYYYYYERVVVAKASGFLK